MLNVKKPNKYLHILHKGTLHHIASKTSVIVERPEKLFSSQKCIKKVNTPTRIYRQKNLR